MTTTFSERFPVAAGYQVRHHRRMGGGSDTSIKPDLFSAQLPPARSSLVTKLRARKDEPAAAALQGVERQPKAIAIDGLLKLIHEVGRPRRGPRSRSHPPARSVSPLAYGLHCSVSGN
jgi:hypothetical protein